MKIRHHLDIIGIEVSPHHYLGFHARNMELAELDQATWDALQALSQNEHAEPTSPSEAAQELLAWNQSHTSQVQNFEFPQQIQSLTLNIAQLCNLRCHYCAAAGDGTYGSDKGMLDLDKAYAQIAHFVNQVPEGCSFELHFFGGEPLLYPGAIKALVTYAKLTVLGRSIDLRYRITTNGTLISPDVAEFLALNKFAVSISLDGPPEVTDHSRPMASKNQKSTTQAIEKGLALLGPIRHQLSHLQFNSVFGPHNLDLIKTYLYLKEFSPDYYNFNYAANDQDSMLSPRYTQALEELVNFLIDSGHIQELKKIKVFQRYFYLLDQQMRLLSHCGAGKSLVQADTKSDLYACNWFMNDPQSQIGSGTTLNEEARRPYLDSLIETHNCQSCWARHLCGGGCMFVNWEKTKQKHTKDLSYCERTRKTAALALKSYALLSSMEQKGESNEAH